MLVYNLPFYSDEFIIDETGYGKIVGRIKDLIIRGGENIYPKEIEDLLQTHPEILEVQVELKIMIMTAEIILKFPDHWASTREIGRRGLRLCETAGRLKINGCRLKTIL